MASGRTVYCTLSSANFLARVFALRASLVEHDPNADVRILLVERPETVRKLNELLGERFYAPDEIDCPAWLQMSFYYDIIEFNTALKPYLIDLIFRETADHPVEKVIYVDADMMFYSSPAPLERELDAASILMTPHLTGPVDPERHTVDEWSVIAGGQFNMGFLGFRDTPNVRAVLQWWKDKLVFDCLYDVERNMYTDQWWGQLFISFEDGVKVLRSEQYNMAWWNICQRRLDWTGEAFVTADGPLVFFHFSSLERQDPGWIARHQRKVYFGPDSAEYRLVSDYLRTVAGFSRAAYDTLGYTFGAYHSGARITGFERKLYHQVLQRGGAPLVDPFDETEFRQTVARNFRFLPRPDQLRYAAGRWLGGFKLKQVLGK